MLLDGAISIHFRWRNFLNFMSARWNKQCFNEIKHYDFVAQYDCLLLLTVGVNIIVCIGSRIKQINGGTRDAQEAVAAKFDHLKRERLRWRLVWLQYTDRGPIDSRTTATAECRIRRIDNYTGEFSSVWLSSNNYKPSYCREQMG